MIAHNSSSQLLWKAAASRPIGVTWSWRLIRPSGWPIPGVGATFGSAAAAVSCAGDVVAGSGWPGF
jgi:hypothetical protein